jgi:hypothetical protein
MGAKRELGLGGARGNPGCRLCPPLGACPPRKPLTCCPPTARPALVVVGRHHFIPLEFHVRSKVGRGSPEPVGAGARRCAVRSSHHAVTGRAPPP